MMKIQDFLGICSGWRYMLAVGIVACCPLFCRYRGRDVLSCTEWSIYQGAAESLRIRQVCTYLRRGSLAEALVLKLKSNIKSNDADAPRAVADKGTQLPYR